MRVAYRVLPVLAIVLLPAATSQTGGLRGFSSEAGRTQREWEAKFRALPDTARLRAAMIRLSARPHHVGSPYGKVNAEWIRDQFTSYGWEARIEEYQVLFPTPRERRRDA